MNLRPKKRQGRHCFRLKSSKNQAEEVYQKVLSEAKKAANAQKQAETLISRYQQEIPEQKKCVEDRKTSYTEVMEIKQMTESEWKELVETYSREAAEEFQKTVNAYYEKEVSSAGTDKILQQSADWRRAETSSVWKKFRKREKLQRQNIRKKKRFITNCEWITGMTERSLTHFHRKAGREKNNRGRTCAESIHCTA